MEERAWLARYGVIALAVVGGLEWLLGRTVSRLGAAPTLEGAPRTIIEIAGKVGLYLISPAFLLAVALLLLASLDVGAQTSPGRYARLALALYLAVFGAVAVVHTFLPTEAWLNAGFNVVSAVAVWWICGDFVRRLVKNKKSTDMGSEPGVHPAIEIAGYGKAKSAYADYPMLEKSPKGDFALGSLRFQSPGEALPAILLVALAYSGWYVYVLNQVLSHPGATPGEYGLTALTLGELFAITAPYAFFAAIAIPGGQWRNPRRWIAPALLGLGLAAGSIADTVFNQGFTGVFTTWSVGLNLVWPWPLYALSLSLFAYSVLTCFAPDHGKAAYANNNMGLGLLLLLMAGYNLQIPYQHLLAILSMLMLAELFKPIRDVVSSRDAQVRPDLTQIVADNSNTRMVSD